MLALPEALTEEILTRSDEVEQARRIPADLSKKLAQAGLYRMCVPKVYGGLEVDPMTLVATIEAIARLQGSVAWCVCIGATSGVPAAYLAEEAARLIYGSDPLSLAGGVFAPKGKATGVEGGYRVSGQWQWGSGTQNCSWIMGGCLLFQEGKPQLLENGMPNPVMMFLPAEEVVILDTWHVSGLRGTGSHDFLIEDQFVPKERAVSLVTDAPKVTGALYVFPVFGLLAISLAGVALGIAQAAIEELCRLAAEKIPALTTRPLNGRPQVQSEVAEAVASVKAARAYLFEGIETAWEAAQQNGEITLDHRVQLRLAATHATTASAKVVQAMYLAGGGSSIFESSPLQRYFRDSHVVTQHMMVAPATQELLGRHLLGLGIHEAMV